MVYNAGQKFASSDADQLITSISQVVAAAQTTGSISMGAGTSDLTGSSASFTTTYANTKIMIWGVYDVITNGGVLITFVGTCVLDGATIPAGEAHSCGATTDRNTVAQMWITTLALAGSHTIKLQGAGN